MKFAVTALLLILSACVGAQAGDLTDDALVAQATKVIHDKSLAMQSEFVLGTHRGQKVLVTSRCSDVCPVYTIRVVHYGVAMEKCTEAGGVKETIFLPFSIAVRSQDFCIPAVLAQKKLFAGYPFQPRD